MKLTNLIPIKAGKTLSRLCIIGALSLGSSFVFAQNQQVRLSGSNLTLKAAFKQIEQQTKLFVDYNTQDVNDSRVIKKVPAGNNVKNVLEQLLEGTNCSITFSNGHVIISKNTPVSSKSKKITGTIKDANGEPIVGANIVEKGTTNGIITDMNGYFSLTMSSASIMQVSYIGFISQEIRIGDKDQFLIQLAEDTQNLDEVVVVGFGTSKRRDVVGSITKINSEELTKLPVTNIADGLQGLSSGLMVTNQSGHPGSAPEIRIRGINSINLSSEPLWIVDGMPIHTSSSDRTAGGTKSVSAISMLNPNDIESIEVLKDAAATAIYGSRASGGVILVTTKSNKGKLTGLQLSYDGGVSKLPFSQNDVFMDSKSWWKMKDLAHVNAGESLTNPDLCMAIQFYGERPSMTKEEAININTDHLGALTQSAFYHQVGLTANKGFETGGVMFSFNYRNEEGLIRDNAPK